MKKNPAPVAEQKAEPNYIVLPEGQVELCAAKGDIRYYLNHPFLDLSDEKRPMLVATNGHVLAAAPVAIHGNVSQGPIPLEAIKRARAAAKKRKTPEVQLVFIGDMCGTPDALFKRPPFDFTYPDWRKIIPKSNGSDPDMSFNGDLHGAGTEGRRSVPVQKRRASLLPS